MDGLDTGARGPLDADQVAAYRRDGYTILRGAIGPRLVAACVDAISGLASGAIPSRSTEIALEAGVDAARLRPERRNAAVTESTKNGMSSVTMSMAV